MNSTKAKPPSQELNTRLLAYEAASLMPEPRIRLQERL